MHQLDLFDGGAARLSRARSLLERFELDAAADDLGRVTARYPAAADARALRDEVEALRAGYRQRIASGASRVDALLAAAPASPELVRGWACAVGRATLEERGPGGRAAGEPAGRWLLRGGELDAAREALRAALALASTDAPARLALADCLYLQGDVDKARREYARAFVEASETVDVDGVADPEVAAIGASSAPSLRQTTASAGSPPPASPWACLRRSRRRCPLGEATEPSSPSSGGPREHPAESFVAALFEERSARSLEDRVAARRLMKRAAPKLLAVYLARHR